MRKLIIIALLFSIIIISGCTDSSDGVTFTVVGWKPSSLKGNTVKVTGVTLPLDEEEVCIIVRQVMSTTTCYHVSKKDDFWGTWEARCCGTTQGIAPHTITISETTRNIKITPGM